ncbi:unnamed protein product, partial [Mesorhabditis belari]|uniref:EGF-like domain-containing protein n=1 Tax=Mesorhabditis belari TaxID=2138241 RepID=A0AAF3EBU3_9BILA
MFLQRSRFTDENYAPFGKENGNSPDCDWRASVRCSGLFQGAFPVEERKHGAICDSKNGTCECPPGYYGATCSEVCPAGRYGRECMRICNCHNGAKCSPVDGSNVNVPII